MVVKSWILNRVIRNKDNIWALKPLENDLVEDQGRYGKIILKWRLVARVRDI
jgi:hypothetical protein